jgi:uroporphyrinogen decarboxylase
MTSRERVLRTLDHREADRIPRYDGFWRDTLINFRSEGMPEPLEIRIPIASQDEPKLVASPVNDFFNFDVDVMFLDNSMRCEAELLAMDEETMIVRDRCGYVAKDFRRSASVPEFIDHVNKGEEDWKRLKKGFSLNPGDPSRIDTESFFLRYTQVPSWTEAEILFNEVRKREKFLVFQGYGMWEGTWRHHGFTECLMDIVSEKAYMLDMFETICELTLETIEYALDMGMKPDGYWMVEDLGCTRSLLISPETYKEMLMPFHKRIGNYLHSRGMKFFMHSCGKIDEILPLLIEAGLDVIQPLQANTGMDVRALKREYGRDITFWGNISAEALSGDLMGMEKEMIGKIEEAKKGGGYMYHSDHSVPSNVSYANYLHAMKLVDKHGSYNM